MLRKLITAAAAAATIGASAAAFAQPTPGQVLRDVDRTARHAVYGVDHVVRRTVHGRRVVYVRSSYRVRALCNDGRVHVGRTRGSACAYHGGVRYRY